MGPALPELLGVLSLPMQQPSGRTETTGLSNPALALLALVVAVVLAACGNGESTAGETFARTHGYEPGRAALVFVYTDG
jgi:hypothetical protein